MDQLAEYERRLALAWTKEDSPGHGLPVQPAPLSKVQQVLKADEVLLEYVLDDPTSFCVVVSQKGAYVRVLTAGRKEIENLSQQFVGEIRTKGTGAEPSKRLYAMLVKPVPETATATRFIIAPDAILNLLPFEASRCSGRVSLEVAHHKLRAFRYDFEHASPRGETETRSQVPSRCR